MYIMHNGETLIKDPSVCRSVCLLFQIAVIESLAESGRRKRQVSCNKRGVVSLAVYYDDAFYNR